MTERDTKPAKRAHRIDVERCYDCPFWDRIDAMPAIGGCEHPSYGVARPVKLEQPPPEWCPLRGALTIVAGPASVIHGDPPAEGSV